MSRRARSPPESVAVADSTRERPADIAFADNQQKRVLFFGGNDGNGEFSAPVPANTNGCGLSRNRYGGFQRRWPRGPGRCRPWLRGHRAWRWQRPLHSRTNSIGPLFWRTPTIADFDGDGILGYRGDPRLCLHCHVAWQRRRDFRRAGEVGCRFRVDPARCGARVAANGADRSFGARTAPRYSRI